MENTEAHPQQEIDRGLTTINRGSKLIPRDLGEAKDICSLLAKADALPREFMGKPANILLAVMHGAEVGLSPAQSLSSIMVVNNRASIWGDALMGIVMASHLYEDSGDSYDAKLEGGTHTFWAKRRGKSEKVVRTFSMEDAKKAGLSGKSGPWQQYPKRMLFMRARAWCLRDAFADLLKGLAVAEEQRDVIETTVVHTPAAAAEAREVFADGINKEKASRPEHKLSSEEPVTSQAKAAIEPQAVEQKKDEPVAEKPTPQPEKATKAKKRPF